MVSSLDEIIDKFGDKERINISIGVRPSGLIHLGNISTITISAIAAYLLGNHRTEVNFTICDLDLPDIVDTPIKGKTIVHYKNIPDANKCHANISEHNSEPILKFLEDLTAELGTKFTVKYLSEIQKERGYREGLIQLVEHATDVAGLFPGDLRADKTLVYPICKECKTANKKEPTFTKTNDGSYILHTRCENPSCSAGPYDVDLRDTSYELAVHFFIDPIRDAVIEPKADLHIFGGDYREPHGKNEVSKADKILKLMRMTGQPAPEIYVGPLFYAQDGKKMSKSAMNGLSFENLKNYFGNDYVKHIVDFTKHIINNKFTHIDFSYLREQFLVDKCAAKST